MKPSLSIGRIGGIAVGFNWSLLVVFWLITWSLAAGALPTRHPGHGDGAYWAAGVVATVVFLGCLLAHELGHALVARRLGMRVEGITLWLFGGVARLGGEASTPRVELAVGVVGPAVSVAAAALFGVTAAALHAGDAPELVSAVPAWLAQVNLVLAVFNLIPAYPLDGGRVLRAVLWSHHGDRLRATATATRSGRAFAYALIAVGLFDYAGGGVGGGLWLMFLGWFLLTAARAEEAAVVLQDALRGVPVRDVMAPDPVVAPASGTVEDVFVDGALRAGVPALPLVDGTGRPVGLLTVERARVVPPARRRSTMVGSVAWPLSEVPCARPDEPVLDLLGRMGDAGDGQALVLDHGLVVGIVSPADVARLVEQQASRGRRATSAVGTSEHDRSPEPTP